MSARKIIHIDMDCFYAAIEMRDDPSLADKPIAVGGSPDRRGVLCTCNYEARKYGIRSAMSSAIALKKCPQLIIIHPNMSKYKSASESLHQIFHEYTDIIEPLSLDEAFLDVSNCDQHQGSATLIAQAIRNKIYQVEKITASAGVAPNKFLAKIASDWNKPNGQTVITPDQVERFVKQLPIEKIFGVGKVTAKKMHAYNIRTCLDLQRYSEAELSDFFGSFGQSLYHLCRGIDNRDVQTNRVRKSVSVEHTYDRDLPDLSACEQKLPALLEELNQRLKNHCDRIIHKQFVKIKFHNFSTTTIECISKEPDLSIYQRLLIQGHARQGSPVRLLGLGVGFDDKPPTDEVQLELGL